MKLVKNRYSIKQQFQKRVLQCFFEFIIFALVKQKSVEILLKGTKKQKSKRECVKEARQFEKNKRVNESKLISFSSLLILNPSLQHHIHLLHFQRVHCESNLISTRAESGLPYPKRLYLIFTQNWSVVEFLFNRSNHFVCFSFSPITKTIG